MSTREPTILLVEDEPDLAAVIRRELAQVGFAVNHACDGRQALEMHARLQPDVVILDWMLPKLDGLDVLRQIRASTPTPVLMLTARGEEIDRVLGLEVGADDYLTKPFSLRELIARVRALLRRVELVQSMRNADQTHRMERLQHKGLILDAEAHNATLDGLILDLSPTEFALLHLLLRNPGRAFSRSYLLETIWGADYVGGDRSVDNAVLRLRKKLGSLADDIETVWGVGYRLRS